MRMASALKTIVSKKKRRFVDGDFNLDLSYILDRLIAMGYPAENIESIYRNSLDEVKRFLEQNHKDHYMIYNLCSERSYDSKKFHGRVRTYPFDDHHPPDFSTIRPFCVDVDDWLAKSKNNVAAVHCKAGKGRTGVMICCYLLHAGIYQTAEDVLTFYGQKRTIDEKGVTIPSQRRYINYYAKLLQRGLTYRPVKLYLDTIVIDPVPCFSSNSTGEFTLVVEVRQNRGSAGETREFKVKRLDRNSVLTLHPPILLCGDVKVEFAICRIDMAGFKVKAAQRMLQPKKEFHFWFNTFFVEPSFSSGLCHTASTDTEGDDADVSSSSSSQVDAGDTSRTSSNGGGLNHHLFYHAHAHAHAHASGGSGGHAAAQASLSLDLPPQNGHLLRSAAAAGGGNHVVRPRPPERHVSCLGGASSPPEHDDLLQLTNLVKNTSVSDDHLLQQHGHAPRQLGNGQTVISSPSSSSSSNHASSRSTAAPVAPTTTALSFSENRQRHSSVPQTLARTTCNNLSDSGASNAAGSLTNSASESVLDLPPCCASIAKALVGGTPVTLRLEKHQIDKAAKDKQCRTFPDDFKVTLFLVKPADQSDAPLLSSSPSCPAGPAHRPKCDLPGGRGAAAVKGISATGSSNNLVPNSSPESSSEEDVPDLEALPQQHLLEQEQLHRNNHNHHNHYQQQQHQHPSSSTTTARGGGVGNNSHSSPLFQSDWI